jgi:hypothetical protein
MLHLATLRGVARGVAAPGDKGRHDRDTEQFRWVERQDKKERAGVSIWAALVRRVNKEATMRFMMIVKASEQSEAGVMPSEQELADMAKFNESMVKAGVMLSGEGLHQSSKGVRIKYSGHKRVVVDGPFAEAKELIAGFWIIQVKSREEAIEWARRVPFNEGEVELRPVFELEDFAPGAAIDHHKELQKELNDKK